MMNPRPALQWSLRLLPLALLLPVLGCAEHHGPITVQVDNKYAAPIEVFQTSLDTAGTRRVTQPVDVYSNAGPVELLVNGRSLGTRTPDDVKKASWQVPFAAGDNVVEARAGGRVDRLVIRMDVVPRTLRDTSFRELAVNVGSNAQYFDGSGPVWVEDRAYTPGSFGYVGGKAALMAREIVITDTKQTPLYVTYRAGLDVG